MARTPMVLHVELVAPDAEFDVETDARDLRKWESVYGASYTSTPSSATQTAQVAHLAAKRAGLFDGDWDAFDGRCVLVRYAVAEGAALVADPTQPEATDASSAS